MKKENDGKELNETKGNHPSLKDQLQAVINLMGHSTTCSESSKVLLNDDENKDTDIDESFCSSIIVSTKSNVSSSIRKEESTDVSIVANLAPSGVNIDNGNDSCSHTTCIDRIPPHMCINPECVCHKMTEYCPYSHHVSMFMPNSHTTMNHNFLNQFNTKKCDTNKNKGIIDWFRTKSGKSYNINNTDFCKNRPKNESVQNMPIIDGIPKKDRIDSKTDTNYKTNIKRQDSTTFYDGNNQRRIDFYYFDHGNAQYFRTTDAPPVMVCELIAEKTENYTTKFWAELFGSVHIFFSFITSFFLQLLRFVLYSIIRPLTIGSMQLWSDYFFKPFLTTLFNAIVQPPLIFLYNIATSLRDLMDPLAEGIGYFFREIAILLKSIRILNIKNKYECNKCIKNNDNNNTNNKPNNC